MATEAPEPTGTETAPKKTNLVPILIVIGVVVVIVIGVGAYLFLKDDDSGTAEPAGPPPPRVSKNLYDAWQADDRSTAAANATGAAVTQIFAIPASDGAGLVFGGCTATAGTPLPKACVFSRPGGSLTMTVDRVGDKRTVVKVDYGPAGLPPDTTG